MSIKVFLPIFFPFPFLFLAEDCKCETLFLFSFSMPLLQPPNPLPAPFQFFNPSLWSFVFGTEVKSLLLKLILLIQNKKGKFMEKLEYALEVLKGIENRKIRRNSFEFIIHKLCIHKSNKFSICRKFLTRSPLELIFTLYTQNSLPQPPAAAPFLFF